MWNETTNILSNTNHNFILRPPISIVMNEIGCLRIDTYQKQCLFFFLTIAHRIKRDLAAPEERVATSIQILYLPIVYCNT